MIKEAIDKILSLGPTTVETINGRTYSNGPSGIKSIAPPFPAIIEINTLTGIVDYKPDTEKHMVHVFDHQTVHVMDKDFIDGWLTRSTYLTANHESPVFNFGSFMSLESFIISIQAMFVQDETTAAMLKVIGNIKEENVKQYSDDGVTQAVTAKKGSSFVDTLPVPNPVTLRPYRTFMEIEQPASTFVFRMQARDGQMPSCALFEADGRMWRLEAIHRIKEWLTINIPDVKIIA